VEDSSSCDRLYLVHRIYAVLYLRKPVGVRNYTAPSAKQNNDLRKCAKAS